MMLCQKCGRSKTRICFPPTPHCTCEENDSYYLDFIKEFTEHMTNEDLIRHLEKIGDTLTQVEVHLNSKDRMNAALHMSSQVRPTPLASAVTTARANLFDLIDKLKDSSSV